MTATQPATNMPELLANLQTAQTRQRNADALLQSLQSQAANARAELLKLQRRERALKSTIAQTEAEIDAVEITDSEEMGFAVTAGAPTGGAIDQMVPKLMRKFACELLLKRLESQQSKLVESFGSLGERSTAAVAEKEAADAALLDAQFAAERGRILSDVHLNEASRQHELMLLNRRFNRAA